MRAEATAVHNPYAPPEAKVSDLESVAPGAPISSAKLYTHQQIGVAAFLGSFLAASWFYAQNLVAIGQPEKKAKALWVGVFATVAMMGIAYMLPDRVPAVVFSVVALISARAYAEMNFRKIVGEHLAAGGKRGSWWVVVGVSLLFVLAILAVVFAITWFIMSNDVLGLAE